MNYERLFALVCIAALVTGSTLASAIVLALRARILRAIGSRPPRVRAQWLMALRVWPMVAGVTALLGVAMAFFRYEPRDTTERAGAVLLLAAAASVALLVAAAWRLLRASARTAACHRLLRRCGRRIDLVEFPIPVWRVRTDFPVAAVSGILRPRLILSSRILDECSHDELLAVLRHERAHVRCRDNLIRTCLLGLPDSLGSTTAGREIVNAWRHATEEAADDAAAAGDEAARVTLAGALVRVARMASGAPPDWMPALALFDGDKLEQRVRRLLQPDALSPAREPGAWVAGAMFAALIASAGVWVATGPRALHDVLEWAVRNLP